MDTIPVVVEDTVPAETTPKYEAESQEIRRLRNRLLRKEEEYQPYNTDMALGADERNVFLFFEVNVTKMDRSFLSNDRLMDSIMFVLGEATKDTTLQITRIQIVGYASFDGRRAYNSQLAAGRANTIKEYIQSNFDLPDNLFVICNGEESWAELKYKLQQIEFEGRDEVIEIMNTEPDPDVREAKIKQLHGGATYRYMRDELRYIMRNLGCITIFYEEIEN
jgi:outer membrane protein OmpA-like peptidoglycan-associated protein